jgi:hypothetical protein
VPASLLRIFGRFENLRIPEEAAAPIPRLVAAALAPPPDGWGWPPTVSSHPWPGGLLYGRASWAALVVTGLLLCRRAAAPAVRG